MQSSNVKYITIPININELDKDSMSKTVYIIDYKSSPLKKEDLLLYIQRLGIIADIDFKDTSYEEKEEMILLYMNSQHFHHFTSFNATIMNCVYKTKNTFLRLKGSCLTSDEEDLFVTNNRFLLNKWISFFDSYLIYMVVMASNKNKFIKDRYPEKMILNDKTLGATAVSLFLDDFFYDYFKTKIDDNNIKYWIYQYENKLYDGKHFNNIILNDANWIFKVLHNTSTDEKWNLFLKEHFQ